MTPETTRAETRTKAAKAAVGVLNRVFRDTTPGIQYRLWDGSEGRVGVPDGAFTIVIRDPEVFVRAFSHSDTLALAEAFVENRIDIEGDLFAALRVGHQVDQAEFGWRDKLAIWRALRRVSR